MDLGKSHVSSDSSQSSSHLETDSGFIGGSGRRRLEVAKLETIYEGEISKHLKEHMAATDRSERSTSSTQPEIIDRSDSVHSEGAAKEGFPVSPTKKLKCGSSSSLDLSGSSERSDLFQFDAHVNHSGGGSISLANPDHGINQVLYQDDESDASSSSISSTKSEKSSTSAQISDVTHESVGNGASPTQSPPLQTMDRVGEYDPFRIPSAVFERSRSITPLEWSIASNESLFSIHVGNNSFSRDHVFMLGDLGKVDELTKSDELFVFNPSPAVIPSPETERKSVGKERKMRTSNCTEDLVAGDLIDPWNSSKMSQRSDRSESSSNSFAFPIKKKRACPSCYCSNCSRAFCYYLWPRCYPSWPSCYCCYCSRAFGYCWNCSRRGLCCHTSNILADEEVPSGSVATDAAKKKHQDTEGPSVSAKPTSKSWFTCCYSFPCCSCPSCCTFSSFPSCCKYCSFPSCCTTPSCSSCSTWSCGCCSYSCFHCPRCHFRGCSHLCRCCHLRPSCHFRPSCKCCHCC